jgi:hypothetical protein
MPAVIVIGLVSSGCRLLRRMARLESREGPSSQTRARVLFHVTHPGYGPPTDEQRNVLWRWLTRGSSDRRLSYEMLTAAKIRRIVVGDERVSTTFNGIVSNASRLRHTINLLRQLASDDGA